MGPPANTSPNTHQQKVSGHPLRTQLSSHHPSFTSCGSTTNSFTQTYNPFIRLTQTSHTYVSFIRLVNTSHSYVSFIRLLHTSHTSYATHTPPIRLIRHLTRFTFLTHHTYVSHTRLSYASYVTLLASPSSLITHTSLLHFIHNTYPYFPYPVHIRHSYMCHTRLSYTQTSFIQSISYLNRNATRCRLLCQLRRNHEYWQ